MPLRRIQSDEHGGAVAPLREKTLGKIKWPSGHFFYASRFLYLPAIRLFRKMVRKLMAKKAKVAKPI